MKRKGKLGENLGSPSPKVSGKRKRGGYLGGLDAPSPTCQDSVDSNRIKLARVVREVETLHDRERLARRICREFGWSVAEFMDEVDQPGPPSQPPTRPDGAGSNYKPATDGTDFPIDADEGTWGAPEWDKPEPTRGRAKP